MIIFFLVLYQRIVSPDHGILRFILPSYIRCRFVPSCSEYGIQAVRRHGARRGSVVFLKRLGRCHPWNEGGYDPLL